MGVFGNLKITDTYGDWRVNKGLVPHIEGVLAMIMAAMAANAKTIPPADSNSKMP